MLHYFAQRNAAKFFLICALSGCSRASYVFKPAVPAYQNGDSATPTVIRVSEIMAVPAAPAAASVSAMAAQPVIVGSPGPTILAKIDEIEAPVKPSPTLQIVGHKALKQFSKVQGRRKQNATKVVQPTSKKGGATALILAGLLLVLFVVLISISL
ncbi:hypothetical protein [uncultured Hymenobacter sp.]|uniref:hypothetical protein n=1 Tax=uncultured Hymenobacter sp. TaxID=170016 RepID=UPI0035C9D51A